jgi:hypothetical protein
MKVTNSSNQQRAVRQEALFDLRQLKGHEWQRYLPVIPGVLPLTTPRDWPVFLN